MHKTYEPLVTTIPDAILAEVSTLRVADVGFGAGPACCAGKFHTYEVPVPLDEALAWIERHRGGLSKAHARLEDGSILWFESSGFRRRETGRQRRDLSPGIITVHPAAD
jgi:hypothetical protein